MRTVKWQDKDGYLHRSLVRDGDPDDKAESGIPCDPPDLNELDWEGVKRDVHNAFVEQGIITWIDLQHRANLRAIIVSALKPRVIALFKNRPEV